MLRTFISHSFRCSLSLLIDTSVPTSDAAAQMSGWESPAPMSAPNDALLQFLTSDPPEQSISLPCLGYKSSPDHSLTSNNSYLPSQHTHSSQKRNAHDQQPRQRHHFLPRIQLRLHSPALPKNSPTDPGDPGPSSRCQNAVRCSHLALRFDGCSRVFGVFGVLGSCDADW